MLGCYRRRKKGILRAKRGTEGGWNVVVAARPKSDVRARRQSGSSATYKHFHSTPLSTPDYISSHLPTLKCSRSRFDLSFQKHNVSGLLRTTARAVAASSPPCPATCVDRPNDALSSPSFPTDTECRIWRRRESLPAIPRPGRFCWRCWQLWPRFPGVHDRSYGTDGFPGWKERDGSWTGIYGTERMKNRIPCFINASLTGNYSSIAMCPYPP